MSARSIEKLDKERRADVFAIPNPEFGDESPFEEELPVHREIIEMLPYELKLDEKRVFDILFGLNGMSSTQSTNAIAKRLGWSPSKVSQVKNSITIKYRNYMDSF